jgi:hypothetical protein
VRCSRIGEAGDAVVLHLLRESALTFTPMSISIDCSRFRQGEPEPFPASALAALSRQAGQALPSAGPSPGHAEPWYEHLSLRRRADGGCVAVSLSRPGTDPALFEALFALLRLEGVVVHAPLSPLVVAHPASAGHLPEGMVEALGEPVWVTTPQALKVALFGDAATTVGRPRSTTACDDSPRR